MRSEHRDLVENGDAALFGLFPCDLDAHDDVAEDAASERGEVTLSHREREDVGWSIFMTIDFVQFVNAF